MVSEIGSAIVEKTQSLVSGNVPEEEHILRQSQADPEAFRPVYEKYYKKLFLFILHRTGERETTADLTQQVFMKALTSLRKFEFRGLPFSAWLYRIAINECNDYFRKTKRARLVVLEETSEELFYEELTAGNSSEELHTKLPAILQQLAPDHLQIIELRFFEGRSFKEVSEILGITENHAKVKTYRILKKMKKLFLLIP